jgi:hypothetical protein
MSMYDKSYCNTVCDQKDCERNLQFNKPDIQYYSVANLDNEHINHKNCEWKIKMGGI